MVLRTYSHLRITWGSAKNNQKGNKRTLVFFLSGAALPVLQGPTSKWWWVWCSIKEQHTDGCSVLLYLSQHDAFRDSSPLLSQETYSKKFSILKVQHFQDTELEAQGARPLWEKNSALLLTFWLPFKKWWEVVHNRFVWNVKTWTKL